jgi:hypothetical protein
VTTIPLDIADKVYGECLKLREREAGLRDHAHSRGGGGSSMRNADCGMWNILQAHLGQR